MTIPSFRDVEQISALLDDNLPQAEAARLRIRISSDPELAAVYMQLSQTRTLLRKLPARRAPRNFTLTPKMAGIKAPTPRVVPFFRFASVFASLLLVLTFAANGLGNLAANAPAAAPAYGIGGGAPLEAPAAEARPQSGGGSDQTEAPAATEAPLAAAPMAPSATAASTAQDSAALTATPEGMRIAVESTSQPEATLLAEAPAAKTGGETSNQPPVPATPASNNPLVPGWLQIGLLAVALLAGGVAWFVNWRANARFASQSRR